MMPSRPMITAILQDMHELLEECRAKGDQRGVAIVSHARRLIEDLTEWNSMETAPRDGTRVLILVAPDGAVKVGYADPICTHIPQSCWLNADRYGGRIDPCRGWLPIVPPPSEVGT